MGVSLSAAASIISVSFLITIQVFTASVPLKISEINNAYDNMKNRCAEQCQTGISITNITDMGWWDKNWEYRKMIIIDHTKVQADQTDFTTLVYISSDADLAAHAQPDGDDIFFTDDNNSTKLSHEIENYSSTDGKLIAWVKNPIIYANTDTVLLMYYGNAGCSSQEDISNSWDSNFKLVQHLNESSGTLYDSTSNDNDGANNGATYNDSSKIDGGYNFDGDSYINCDDSNSLDITNQITLEAWVKDPPLFLPSKKQNAVKIFDKKAINITKAKHLDEKRDFLRDIYDYVKLKDDTWSEPINDMNYIQVTFEQPLDESNYITIFARSLGIGQIKVYPQNNDTLIATFSYITGENWYKVYLTNLKNECSTFDLQTIGDPIEYDYIVDPETKDAVDNNTTNMDSSEDKGTESNFTNAQDTSPDTDVMTIQEADQGTPAVNENKVVDGFTSTWTAWDEYGLSPYLDADGDGSYIFETTTDLDDEGWFTFQDTAATGPGFTVVLYVDFDAGDGNDDCNWYIDTTGDNNPEFSGRFTNPTTAIVNTGTIAGLDTATEINAARLWLEYDSTGTAGDMIVDYAYLNIRRAQVIDYEIDFEYNWSNADFDEDYEEVCIYVSSHTGSENLNVNYWSGSWTNLGQITSTGWTNLTATGLTDATYEIQLIGASESGDTLQDSWNIDAVMLHTWPNNTVPIITNESPTNGSLNVSLNPTLSIQVNDSEGHQMNITWYWGTNSTCSNFIGINDSVSNGTYFMMNDNNFSSVSKTYYWKVVVNDGYGGWTNATYHFRTTGDNKEIISKERNAYALEISADGTILYGIINNTNVTASTDTNWHYVVLTYDGTTIKLYQDGKLKNSTTLIGSIPTNNNDLMFGKQLTGTLDELHISAISRSSEWINTTYKMMSSPASFIKIETEQNQQYTYMKIKIKNTGSTTIKTQDSTILINGTDKPFIKIQPYLYPLKEMNIIVNVSTAGSKRNKFITGNGITKYEGYG